jgi:hypothetical protein
MWSISHRYSLLPLDWPILRFPLGAG